MTAIAIVGPDGAGKTTLTRRLAGSGIYPFKHIYMGLNIEACNVALPTTLWAERIRQRMDGKQGHTPPGAIRRLARKWLRSFRKGKLCAAAGLLIALAEDWYRQLVSWYYQWDGFIVIYDRHFVFDLWDNIAAAHQQPLSYRIRLWCLKYFYPRPNLVIFLDAPSEVLYARKSEWSLQDLEQKRQTLIRVGKTLPNFFRVDATQPPDKVYEQVLRTIVSFCSSEPKLQGATGGCAALEHRCAAISNWEHEYEKRSLDSFER